MPSGAGLRRPDGVLVAGQRHAAAVAATEWADLVRATVAPPGRPVRPRRGARLADRGVERAEPHGVLAGRRPGRLPPAVRGDRARGQGRRRVAAGRRPGHLARRRRVAGAVRRVRHRPRRAGRLRQPARLHLRPGPARAVRRPPDAGPGRGRCWSSSPRPAGTWPAPRWPDLPVHITEFNSSYRPDNPIHDTAFHAAYLAPVLAGGGDLVDSFSYWTFSDVFEEAGVPTSLFHGGFGLLTHRQIKKPTYHLYAFMARMGDEVLARGRGPPGHPATPTAGSPCWPGRRWTSPDATRRPTGTPLRAVRSRVGRPGDGSAFLLRSSVARRPATPGRPGARWAARARPGPGSSTRCGRRPNRPARHRAAAGRRRPGRPGPHPRPARGDPGRVTAGARRDPAVVGRQPAARRCRRRPASDDGASAARRQFGDGPLSRAAASVYTLLVVEAAARGHHLPGLVLLCCSTATPATCRSSRACALPVGPAVSAAAVRAAPPPRRPDRPASRRPRSGAATGSTCRGVLRIWVPLLLWLAVVGGQPRPPDRGRAYPAGGRCCWSLIAAAATLLAASTPW